MNEQSLIAAITAQLQPRGERNIVWTGDDAAVVASKNYAYSVTSTDIMVDGVHFRRSQLTATEIGHRALAGALSDLAAMGVQAGEAYIALTLPSDLPTDDVLALCAGAEQLAQQTNTTIAGGDISRGPTLSVCVTAVGWAERKTDIVTRAGANVGDLIGVTGGLGGSGGGLAVLERRANGPKSLLEKYKHPLPRFYEGNLLAQNGATAMIDISDGLATDAAHLGRSSGVLLEVDLAQIPLTPGVAEVATALGQVPAEFAVQAGEEYELCFCAPASVKEQLEAAIAVTWIGTVTGNGAGARFYDQTGEHTLTGYSHT